MLFYNHQVNSKFVKFRGVSFINKKDKPLLQHCCIKSTQTEPAFRHQILIGAQLLDFKCEIMDT